MNRREFIKLISSLCAATVIPIELIEALGTSPEPIFELYVNGNRVKDAYTVTFDRIPDYQPIAVDNFMKPIYRIVTGYDDYLTIETGKRPIDIPGAFDNTIHMFASFKDDPSRGVEIVTIGDQMYPTESSFTEDEDGNRIMVYSHEFKVHDTIIGGIKL